jgi:hypothetical protein
MKIKGLGGLWREVKGLESLGVGHSGRPARSTEEAGTLESWEVGGLASGGRNSEGFQGCHPVKIGLLCVRAWFGLLSVSYFRIRLNSMTAYASESLNSVGRGFPSHLPFFQCPSFTHTFNSSPSSS